MRHPDEGTIHAWLDGQLPPEEAAALEAHVAQCTDCAAAVAEARGLIAASSRILSALDDVPGGVIPRERSGVTTVPGAGDPARQPARARRSFRASRLPIAAAIAFVAAGTVLVTRAIDEREVMPPAGTIAFEALEAVPSGEDASPLADSGEPANLLLPPATPRVTIPPAPVSRGEEERSAPDRIDEASAAASTDIRSAAPAPPPSPQLQAAGKRAAAEIRPEAVTGAPAGVFRRELAPSTATGAIAGRVTDERGKAIAGASVTLPAMGVGAVTDSIGQFVLEGVPAGRHDVTVRRIGYERGALDVTVSVDDTARVRLALPQSELLLSAVVVGSSSSTDDPASRCYAVEAGRWATEDDAARNRTGGGEALPAGLPDRLVLGASGDASRGSRADAPQASAAAAQSGAARVAWTELSRDSLRVTWMSDDGTMRLVLSGRSSELTGEATRVDASGRIIARASAKAEPVVCGR